MIIKLYKNNRYRYPLISILLCITCAIVTIPTSFHRDLWYVFALSSKPFFFWQVFSGVFEHSISPNSIFPDGFIWVHFFSNMSIVIVCGVLVERLIGSKKMLLLTLAALVSHVLFFQIRYWGGFHYGSGTSGIVYAYAPVAFYSLIRYIKESGYTVSRDWLFYVTALPPAEGAGNAVFLYVKSSYRYNLT